MRSYEEILEHMKTVYRELTYTDPDEASDIAVRLSVLAGEIFAEEAELNWLRNQMFPTTAQGEYLELHAMQRGIERKSGTKAEGDVDFYLPYLMNYDVEIPAGTIVATSGENPVRFETTRSTTITSGRLSSNAPIRALQNGADGNVDVQTIDIIVTPVAGVSSVRNDYRTDGGSDDENDEQLRKRVLKSFVDIPNGTNKAYYEALALSVEGVAFASVIPRLRGPGTVDVFITDSSGSPSNALLNNVERKLQRNRELNVDIQVRALGIIAVNVYLTISVIEGYDFEVVKSNCEDAIISYFNSLSGGESVYVTAISEAIAHVEGVKDHSFEPNLTYDRDIPADCAARCGTITITER